MITLGTIGAREDVRIMAASGDHLKALVRSHGAGDDASFYATALQVAAQAARQGHNRLATELKQQIETARGSQSAGRVTAIAQPRGELADLVLASFPEVDLRDLVTPPALGGQLRQILAEQRQRHTLVDHGFDPVHRLLLEGPPGTGKTMTASVLARELSLPLLTIRLDSLMSKYLGETASKLRLVFEAAAEQRAVYFFDEFDALGGDRAGNDVGEARRILNSFLVFLEQVSAESIIIAATNHRELLDRALFRRFDLVLTYDLPAPDQAVAIMRARLGSLGRGVRWPSLAAEAQGLSHADLVRSAEAAAKQTLLRGDRHATVADLRESLKSRRSAGGG